MDELPTLRLKFKYRDPANYPVRSNGKYRSRTGNCNGPTPKKPKDRQGNGPRRIIGK